MIKNVLKFIVFFLISIITNKVNSQTYTQGSVPVGAADGTLTQDNANLYWDLTNKRLGIKTNTPSDNLQVIGSSRFGGSTTATNTVITANGDIGIGVTPITNMALQVQRNVNSTVAIRFENTNTGANAFAAMQFGQDINTTGTKFLNIGYGNQALAPYGVYQPQGSFIVNNGTGPLALGAANATSGINFFAGGITDAYKRMTIGANGYVGIGTTTPSAPFQVAGNTGTRGFRVYGSNSPYGTELTGDAGGWAFGYNFAGSAGTALGGFGAYGTNDALINYYIGSYASQKMTILTNGNVGIGTTAPATLLSIVGTTPGTGAVLISSGNTNTGLANAGGIHFSYGNNANTTTSNRVARIMGVTESGGGGDLYFETAPSATGAFATKMVILQGGNVGIGTTKPTELLSVNGAILAQKVKVLPASNTTAWPDYVFHPSYELRSLTSLEEFINEYKHLPDMPSAEEVAKDGLDVGSTQAGLLKKIEELTLYVIKQNKQQELEKLAVCKMNTKLDEQQRIIDGQAKLLEAQQQMLLQLNDRNKR